MATVESGATVTLTVAEWERLANAADEREPFLAAMVRSCLPCPACDKTPVRGKDSTIYGPTTQGRVWHMACWARSTLPAHVAAILPD